MKIELSSHSESLLMLLKERLNATEVEVIEEVLLCLFHKY